MLLEDGVVDAVVAFIVPKGCTIQSTAHANDRGDDIDAIKHGHPLLFEAKGAGSSKTTTKRFGQVSTSRETRSARTLGWPSSALSVGRQAALPAPPLAFPDNRHHRDRVNATAPALAEVGIGVLWVSEEHVVTLQAPWDL